MLKQRTFPGLRSAMKKKVMGYVSAEREVEFKEQGKAWGVMRRALS